MMKTLRGWRLRKQDAIALQAFSGTPNAMFPPQNARTAATTSSSKPYGRNKPPSIQTQQHSRPSSQTATAAVGSTTPSQLRAELLEATQRQQLKPTAVDIGKDAVYLQWENGVQTGILTSVLRANCYCKECRHPETNQRHFDIGLDVPTSGDGPEIEEAKLGEEEGIALEVIWRDVASNLKEEECDTVDGQGNPCKLHHSRYTFTWLVPRLQQVGSVAVDGTDERSNEFDISQVRADGIEVVQLPGEEIFGREKSICLWDKTIGALKDSKEFSDVVSFPKFPYEHVIDDKEETSEDLLKVIDAYHKYGFLLLQGAPQEQGVVEKIANRLGYVRPTHYGRLFSVKSKKLPESLAYTSGRLGFHTDLPYREDTPAIQMLHCIENDSEGGESTLCDGFKAAADLARYDPQSFKLLALRSFVFTWQGKQGVYLKARKPIIQAYLEHLRMLEDAVHTGQWPTVKGADIFSMNPENSTDTWNDPNTAAYAAIAPALQAIHLDNRNMSTSAIYDSPLEEGKALMQAYARFVRLIENKQSELAFKLAPGEVLLFNNRRCLHGRREFDPSTGSRHLEGCYMDSDLMFSTYQATHAKVFGSVTDTRFDRPDPSIAR